MLLFQVLSQALQGRNLEELSLNELTQILSDIELLVRELSEELVSDLGEQFSSPSRPIFNNRNFLEDEFALFVSGVRDELEYEKELKNTFISLLLSIQSRRRACGSDSGGGSAASARASRPSRSSKEPGVPTPQQYKYLTTVIPYQPEKGTPTLQVFFSIIDICSRTEGF